MFKKIICVILLLSLVSGLFALDMSKATPYSDDEFPKFALDLRRAEIIFAGGIPLIYPATKLVLQAVGKELDFWPTMGITCSITAAIALADYLIGLFSGK